MKVYDEAVVSGKRFAILVDDQTKEAYEAVWSEKLNNWNTDFSYPVIGVDSFDVAGSLDFEGCRNAGYTFVD